jgi:serine/threonine protein kinase
MSAAEVASGSASGRETSGLAITEIKGGKVKTVVNGVEIVVSSKYKILRSIGSGAYGIVCSALDTSVDPPVKVAVKVIKNNYKDLVDAKRILREIKLLRFFGRHENIVELYDLDEPEGGVDHEDVTIVTGLMETDMHRVIYSKQRLSDDHAAYVSSSLASSFRWFLSAYSLLLFSLYVFSTVPLPASAWPQVHAQCQHHPSRLEAFQLAAKQ